MDVLIPIGVWIAFVAFACWLPPWRSGIHGFLAFVLTILLVEIPLVAAAVFIATTALSMQGADLTSTVLLLLVASSFAVIVATVLLQWRTTTAGPALAAALDGELGQGWQAAVPASTPHRLRDTTPWWRGILLPFERRKRQVRRTRNVVYGPDPRVHTLDLYRGPYGVRPQPVLIHFHGGGFTRGRKSREGVLLLNQLAQHGWLCISANYRLRSDSVFPDALVDAKRAIAWVRDQATALGADPQQVFVVGSSAGGHLALSAALTPNWSRLQPGFADKDTRVAGAVILYGYLGPLSADPMSSPINLARSDAPPLLFVHGSKDTMVPADGPRAVASALRHESAAPVVFAELPHTQHGFDFTASVRSRSVTNAVEYFLEWTRRTHRRD